MVVSTPKQISLISVDISGSGVGALTIKKRQPVFQTEILQDTFPYIL